MQCKVINKMNSLTLYPVCLISSAVILLMDSTRVSTPISRHRRSITFANCAPQSKMSANSRNSPFSPPLSKGGIFTSPTRFCLLTKRFGAKIRIISNFKLETRCFTMCLRLWMIQCCMSEEGNPWNSRSLVYGLPRAELNTPSGRNFKGCPMRSYSIDIPV